MKVTTEKMPNSTLALDIEVDQAQVEKALDRAARRISQKHTIPGFRKGKAPRFIIERYFGLNVLMEEASEDLLNRSFKDAIKQEKIVPVGPASIEPTSIEMETGFRFRVTVPVSPTVTLPDYHAIRIPLDMKPVTDEILQEAMNVARERHVVFKELEEPRPAREGDSVTTEVVFLVDGKQQKPAEGEEPAIEHIPLIQERIKDHIFASLLGVTEGETREISYIVPDDYEEERMRGKEVTYNIHVTGIQERLLPDWEELPELETFEGTLDDYKSHVRSEIEKKMRAAAEKKVFETFVETLVAQATFDVSQVTLDQVTENMYRQNIEQLSHYGLTEEQFLKQQGVKREDVINFLAPQAKENLYYSLALLELAKQENIVVTKEEIDEIIDTIIDLYGGEQQDRLRASITDQYRQKLADELLEKKLSAHIVKLVTQEDPADSSLSAEAATDRAANDESQPTEQE